MRNTRRDSRKSAALALGLALGGGWTVQAQDDARGPASPPAPGAGTGAGGFSGVVRNRSGSISGVGPSSISGDEWRGGPLSHAARGSGAVTFGPGRGRDLPQRSLPGAVPAPRGGRQPDRGQAATQVTSDLLENARQIADPAERSLALRQIANGAIASNQLVLAHHTLEEAITAASQVNVPLVRDQRLIGLVTSLTSLDRCPAADRPRESERDGAGPGGGGRGNRPAAETAEATVLIRLARLEWRRAVYLAAIIGNPTYRNEMLYRVAENEAIGSVSIANDFAADEIESLGNRPGGLADDRRGLPSRRNCRGPSATPDRPPSPTTTAPPPGRRRPRIPRRRPISSSWPTKSWWTPGMSPTRSTG